MTAQIMVGLKVGAKEKMRGGKAPSPRFGKCGVVRTVFCSGDLGP